MKDGAAIPAYSLQVPVSQLRNMAREITWATSRGKADGELEWGRGVTVVAAEFGISKVSFAAFSTTGKAVRNVGGDTGDDNCRG
ncbi:hypothetical protein TNCV_403571 [Trichonephila clavipes]|nr:hypothetical protein TNCV_403571 [Trichonephila clavipes]